MFIPKKDRLLVYSYLFREGVLVAHKDVVRNHPEIPVKNLYVLKLMQSLESRELVKHSFNWRHNYYYLTNTGIIYIREFLHLPDSVNPATWNPKKSQLEKSNTSQHPYNSEGDGANAHRVPAHGYYHAPSSDGSYTAGRGRGYSRHPQRQHHGMPMQQHSELAVQAH